MIRIATFSLVLAGAVLMLAPNTTRAEERATANLSVCGLVSAWTAPERGTAGSLIHRVAGSITVGTHTYAIAAGTVYSLINAPPVVGQPTCLLGSLDSSGALIQYGAQPGLPSCIGGRIERYAAPTKTADGEIRFAVTTSVPSTPESYRFRIPAGTTFPVDAGSGRYCFTLTLDARGDAVASGARIAEAGGVAAESPRPASLPSTSTERERLGG
jgi:hypothetical protein